jgi:tetratricopeptide (TPR) repeat protein/predicted aspartyl protease
MLRRLTVTLIGILGLLLTPVAPAATCHLGRILELPITMNGLRPLVNVQVNGTDTRFLADSGMFYSSISPPAAAELKLNVRRGPFGLTVRGVAGDARQVDIAVVNKLTLGGITLTRPLEFLVVGGDVGSGASGILGQNFFRIGDVEYDLTGGAIRLWKTEGSCRSANLIYWLKDEQSYSVMDIEWATPRVPHTQGEATLNGTRIHVMFDTGSATSMLTLRAARRAGITPDSPGVVYAGESHGIGRGLIKTWVAPFESFKVGDEEVRHTRLRIGDFDLDTDTEMLIGADFFLSHRVYVASSQHKLYFTYNGGPVFNLTTNTSTASAETPATGEPTTAEEFSRRGTALTARHDFVPAIADLTRACELAPNEPQYFFERAQAYAQNKQLPLAAADLDQVLKLKPDHVQALLWRAERRAHEHDEAGALADLDNADHAASPQADARFAMGEIYGQVHQFTQAITQFNLWIAVHDDDARIATAYAARCRARAMSGQELDKALGDCNKAVHINSGNFVALDSRGLVRLRLGDFGRAVADYTDALKLQSRNPWSLYGRGLAEGRQKNTAASAGDMAAATALAPHIADEFKKMGLAP